MTPARPSWAATKRRSSRAGWPGRGAALLAVALLSGAAGAEEERNLAAGPRYEAGGVHRFFLSLLDPKNVVSVALAGSEGTLLFYVHGGFTF